MDWYGTSHLGQDNLGHPTGPIGTSHWTNWDVPLDHCGTSNIDQDHLGHHRTCGNGRDVPLGHPILPKTIWNFPWTTWDVPLDQCGTSNIAQDHLGHHRTSGMSHWAIPSCPRQFGTSHGLLGMSHWTSVGHLPLPKTTWAIPSCPRPFGTSHWTNKSTH